MSYAPAFASELIHRGELPATVRTFVFQEGTLGNYSFLAIPFNAANVPGALVAMNELMSVESMLLFSRTTGELFPHRLESLNAVERSQVEGLQRSPATLPIETLQKHFVPEPDAEYLNRFDREWNAKVLRQ
jgi:putative spermidine/putrescine transport system substrate-binding protein